MAIQAIQRDTIEQTFFGFNLAVGVTPTPLAQQLQMPSMIQSMILCNPSTNGNSVFFGDQNVSTLTGIELIVGTAVQLSLLQDRQFYELQDPTLITAQIAACQQIAPVSIPVIVWNPSNFWFVAAIAANINIVLFRNVYT
jgi:hypothetical protein